MATSIVEKAGSVYRNYIFPGVDLTARVAVGTIAGFAVLQGADRLRDEYVSQGGGFDGVAGMIDNHDLGFLVSGPLEFVVGAMFLVAALNPGPRTGPRNRRAGDRR